MLLEYADGRTGLTTTAFRYRITEADGTLVKGWTTGATWTESPAGTYTLTDAAGLAGMRYEVEPATGEVGAVGDWYVAAVDGKADTLLARATEERLAELDAENLPADVAATLKAADYTAPDNASIAAILVNTTSESDEGLVITPATLGTDGLPIGRVMPYGKITAWLDGSPEWRFNADADGDFSYTLPYGSIWTLIAKAPTGDYEDAIATVSTVDIS